VLLWVNYGRPRDRLTVANRSGQAITLLQVRVGGETHAFRDVAAGADVAAPLGGGDERVAGEGQLADGTRVRGQFANAAAVLVVLPGGQIELRPAGKLTP
jgi:hypothetical protein